MVIRKGDRQWELGRGFTVRIGPYAKEADVYSDPSVKVWWDSKYSDTVKGTVSLAINGPLSCGLQCIPYTVQEYVWCANPDGVRGKGAWRSTRTPVPCLWIGDSITLPPVFTPPLVPLFPVEGDVAYERVRGTGECRCSMGSCPYRKGTECESVNDARYGRIRRYCNMYLEQCCRSAHLDMLFPMVHGEDYDYPSVMDWGSKLHVWG